MIMLHLYVMVASYAMLVYRTHVMCKFWLAILVPKFVGACGSWCMIFTVVVLFGWSSAMNDSACCAKSLISS